MKRVSVRMFFTVMWRGMCQALGWFFGLFGYKRDGKFAKCVWGGIRHKWQHCDDTVCTGSALLYW